MPYIRSIERIDRIVNKNLTGPGKLNYIISIHLNEYIKEHGLNYQTLNDILGAVEGAKLEIYRRVAAPYENSKIAENGDVFDYNSQNTDEG